ncbi:MAG: DUF2750 domain-containing protein [Acinetobacter sp.]|jgi:hypothetical protein|nr:MAG: DUF2750 domain-containing protein [Acinetobacter sp.]
MVNPYKARRTVSTSLHLNTPQERYRYFIQTIVETQQVWGLFNDGWAIGASSEGRHSLPVWAGRSYASLCQTEFWSSYAPTMISLDNFIFQMLPYIAEQKVLLSIMMTPEGQSVFLEPNRVLLDLKHYLYEIYTKNPAFFKAHPDVPLPRTIRIHT